jgi:hypothetical protein
VTDGAPRFHYRFRFASGREAEVDVELDRDAPESRQQPRPAPEWTRLIFHRCSHCSLAASVPDCPLVEACGGVASHDPATVEALLPERLRPASERDSAVNALVLLDLLAKMVPYSVEDSLAEIRYLFDPFDPYFPLPSVGR